MCCAGARRWRSVRRWRSSSAVSAPSRALVHPDHVISIETIRRFKTSPESCGLVQQVIPVKADDILFVSSNARDALGATWFGFKTLWVNRRRLPYEAIGPRPSYTGENLREVLTILTNS